MSVEWPDFEAQESDTREWWRDEGGEDTECPTCGRDDFESRRGMKSHHWQAHGESIAGVKVVCHWCGEGFRKNPSNYKKTKRSFCPDKDCYQQWQAKHRSGNNNPGWKGGRVTKKCGACGSDITRFPSDFEQGERNFCDHDCRGQWVSENLTGENNPSYKERITLECSQCGCKYGAHPSREGVYDRAFCSRNCKNEWQSENIRGENHPNWKDGVTDYAGFTGRLKEKVRERDGRECQDCGMTQDEHHTEYGRNLDVHHIRPVRLFEDSKDAHTEENLITLCRGCHHSKWERMAPLTPHVAD